MIDKKTFKKAFATPFENAGFVKNGQSWYLDGKDAIIVVNLQKSDWEDMYYINIGIWLKALGETSFPRENQCHLMYRAESLFPDNRELLLLGCSLEKGNLQLLNDLTEFIQNQLIPLLQGFTNENNLKVLMAQGKLNRGLVRLEAKWRLSGS